MWVECMNPNFKTYDELPSSEQISLNFVSQFICLAISSREATAGSAYKAQYAGIVIGKHP